MANTPEKKVKDRIKALCKAYGAYYTMPVMTGMASNGTPDILVCHRGQFAGVEAKAGKGKPTKLQMVRLVEIVRAGGTALVINEDNMGVFESWLEDPAPGDNLSDW
jgi:hypothetical protein